MYNVLWHNSFVKNLFQNYIWNKREIWIAIKLIWNISTLVDVSNVFKVLLSRVSTMIGPFLKRYMLFLERITSWLFWCVGALYTAHIIATSITRFFKYPSIITARNGISGWYQRFFTFGYACKCMSMISMKKLHFQSFSYAHIQCIQNTNWEIITPILTVKLLY